MHDPDSQKYGHDIHRSSTYRCTLQKCIAVRVNELPLTVHQGHVPRFLLSGLLREMPQHRHVGSHGLVQYISRHERLHTDLTPPPAREKRSVREHSRHALQQALSQEMQPSHVLEIFFQDVSYKYICVRGDFRCNVELQMTNCTKKAKCTRYTLVEHVNNKNAPHTTVYSTTLQHGSTAALEKRTAAK